MAIARNVGYTTIQVPAMDARSMAAIQEFVAQLHGKYTANLVDDETLAAITAAVLAAITEMHGEDHEMISAITAAAGKAVTTAKAAGAQGELKISGVNDETAAMLMAMVASSLGADLSQLCFKSIRAL